MHHLNEGQWVRGGSTAAAHTLQTETHTHGEGDTLSPPATPLLRGPEVFPDLTLTMEWILLEAVRDTTWRGCVLGLFGEAVTGGFLFGRLWGHTCSKSVMANFWCGMQCLAVQMSSLVSSEMWKWIRIKMFSCGVGVGGGE